MSENIKILAIETSCDETSASVSEDSHILSNVISSSIDLHSKYGGVVPEIAARAHIEAIIPVIEEALKIAKTDWEDIDAIAVTEGPGLLGSLLVGVNTAKTLAFTKNKPLIPVHHIEGHIYSAFAENDKLPLRPGSGQAISNFQSNLKEKISNSRSPKSEVRSQPAFPVLALVVSGGHTSLILMENHFQYKILGQTIDDAAGEVFDKVAKLLNLGYPGGPIVSQLAEKGDPRAYDFPRVDLTPEPRRNKEGYLEYPEPSLDFSFSGLKTAVLNEIRSSNVILARPESKHDRKKDSGQAGMTRKKQITNNELLISNICASFQQTVIDILIRNSANACEMYKPKSFIFCGGVSANKELRNQLKERIEALDISFKVPEISLSTDNAAMIAIAAYRKYQTKSDWSWKSVNADPNLKLGN